MFNQKFAIFILTHGRPDKVVTFTTLQRSGYTGKIYFVLDNEDASIEKYAKNYGKKNILVFNKEKVAAGVDEGDNFEGRSAILYARHACFDFARQLGLDHFIQLDDDYSSFQYVFKKDLSFGYTPIRNLDSVFDTLVDFHKATPTKSIAMAQGGDFIGGGDGTWAKKITLHRKCMNSFICSPDRPINFSGKMNEDVTTYVCYGSRGHLFFTVPFVKLSQLATQSTTGGMTDYYKKNGTYTKSFFSVMYSPSCVKIRLMGNKNKRLHHSVSWKNAVPKIISEMHRKQSQES